MLYYYERHYSKTNLLTSFAETQALLGLSHYLQQPILHFWDTDPCVILGMRDQRLPQLATGLSFLKQQHYSYFMRHSGGLAVVSDPGVLNVSLILPHAKIYSIPAAYSALANPLMMLLSQHGYSANIGEITHSYCPGSFDLAVHHQKIAGIAQRRSQGAVAIMLYLSLTGSQWQRSHLMQQFYEISQAPQPDFPTIDPTVMTSLAELKASSILTRTAFSQELITILQQTTNLTTAPLNPLALKEYPHYLDHVNAAFLDLKQRNDHLI